MIDENSLVIAVDFDGTIVEDAYPLIGKPKPFAFDSLKKLQQKGHRLILWTYRKGDRLKMAVEFCQEHGVEFYAVNHSFPEEEYNPEHSRKIHADLFIDDRSLGGLPNWGDIYYQITKEFIPMQKKNKKKRRFWLFR